MLASIWSDVLGVERVGASDSFFELGGHSLLATRVISRIRDAFAAEVPLRALFEAPTLAGLAARIEAEMREAAGAAVPPLVPVSRDGPVPLSFAQERLWFIDQMQPGSVAYNMPTALRLGGDLHVRALERALGEIVRRHEVLRVRFHSDGDRPVQLFAPADGFTLHVEDLSTLEPSSRDAEAARLAEADARTPFDLAAGPLFRARLLRLADDEHVLLVAMHHAVSDGWSMDVFSRELFALYAAFSEGLPSPLPELAVQYADYAVWQRAWLAGGELERQLGYWRERLAGAPAVLELPTDHPRPAVQSFRGGEHVFALPRELGERMRAVARASDATPFMAMMAAWQVMLAKLSGQDDVVVGTPIANRTRGETEPLIGYFANTLALRTDVGGDPSFREVLGRVREATLGAYAHQDLPFEKLVEELKVPRDLSHSPVFQVMFSYQDVAIRGAEAAEGLAVSGDTATLGTAKFDLTLALMDHGGEVVGALEYASDLFDAATAERIAGHFATVLAAVTEDADAPLSRVSLLAGDERTRVLEDWNATATDYPRAASIHALFAAQAAATPDALAIEFGASHLSYAELDALSSRLATHLRSLGVGIESRVGVSMERSAEFVVTLLAILKTGAAYVPLDPSYPADRLAFMLDDSQIGVLLVEDALPEALASFTGTIISLSGDAERIAAESPASPEISVFPESLAYVVYTSGSTGKPKGIGIPHQAVVRLVRESNYVQLISDDRVAQVSNASFDAATFEVWGALLNGASLIGIDRDVTLSPERFVMALREMRIGTMFLTTALFNQIAREIPDGFSSLDNVLFGGEAVDPSAVRAVLHAGGPTRLLHVYGPTESTTFATWHQVDAVDEDAGTVPIGAPLSNTTTYVLDREMQPVPVGVTGELYIGGDGLARGYLGRAGLTAERFVPNPFIGGQRLYKTGDAVRWNASGAIEFVGRLDEQVKIRGFRIELGEIEAALSSHASVRDVTVIAGEDVPGNKRLVAYVVASTESVDVDAAVLRAHLTASLPEYMVPSAFVTLDALPLTPNGKVNRRALPAPELSADAESYVAPRNAAEEVVAGVWSEVLGVERIGVHDNFFEMGGHSLLATQVVTRIRNAFGSQLPLRALFEAPTVAGLAAKVEAARADTAPAAMPPVTPAPRDGEIPLSFAQERMWFLDQMEPGTATFNMPAPLLIHGPLDAAALERALGGVVQRHESLRTSFPQVGGKPVQRISPAGPAALPVLDLAHLPETERRRELDRLTAEDVRAPFDLASGPLFRARLIRLTEDEHALLLNVHHAVSDGWSTGVLMTDLDALYAAFRDGRASPLAPLPVQYADFAVAQRAWLTGEVLETQLGYWRDRFATLPAPLDLPTDRPRPAVQTHRGGLERFRLPAELADALDALARREGATLFMVLLAAFKLLLSRYTGQADVTVGTPIAGRTRPELEGLVGLFLNTLALRTDLSGDPDFRALLARVRETTLGAYGHQDVPFERVLEEEKPPRSLSHTPLFQVMFNMTNFGRLGGGGGTPALHAEQMPPPEGLDSKFDMTLYVDRNPSGVGIELIYNADLFDAARMREMLGQLRSVLEQAVRDPAAPAATLSLVTPDAREVLPDPTAPIEPVWNGAVHEMVSASARTFADRVSVRDREGEWTYAELEMRTNRLARHLAESGIGAGDVVAVYAHRSAALTWALLGILKAGAAFVILDPAYPAARLAERASMAQPRGWITIEAAGEIPETLQQTVDALAPACRVTLSMDDAHPDSLLLAGYPADAPMIDVDPDTLAYLAFTSGTTGAAKAVMGTHGPLSHFFAWHRDTFAFGADDCVSMLGGLSHDPLLRDVFAPLVAGGTSCIPDPDRMAEPGWLAAWMAREAVTVAHLTPAMGQLLASASGDAGLPTLPHLRLAFFGGEMLSRRDAARIREMAPGARCINFYGATETPQAMAWHQVAPSPEREVLPVGRGIDGVQLLLLTPSGALAGIGETGEVAIRTPYLARGYLGDPELTAAKFAPNPLSELPGDRIYRTGDLGRYLPNGEVEMLGRADAQVKVRGFRVELGEVEAALARHPSVRDAAAALRETAAGRTVLVGYVVAAGEPPTAAELRRHMGEQLPDYMVPAAFVLLDAMPVTANGKVDRRALPAPEATGGEADYVAPRDETEESLAAIWAEVLRVERVGVEDNFFALGGHSLLATQVVARIQQAHDIPVPLRTFFEGPTIAALAQFLRDAELAALAAMMDDLDALTDDEIAALLAAEAAGTEPEG
ncbi:MAG TPA: amino acid adenylation domain-containing protein [Longimicrobiaceae bacterium]|nr:amino acid adenylation domain-containing protein [Longimicrobiaceae bacterium]